MSDPVRQMEMVSVSSLRPHPKNSKKHTPAQIDALAALIQRYGFTQPVLIDEDGVIIAGHGRTEAAKSVGLEEIPAIRLVGLTDEEKRALIIADNRVAEKGTSWDEAMLKSELSHLMSRKFDLNLTGFALPEIDLRGIVKKDPEQLPEGVTEKPVTAYGDVWQIGAHRIMCGDACREKDVQKLLGEDVPHLMVTDPPYGIEHDPSWRNERLREEKTNDATGKVENDDKADWGEAWALFPGDVAYVWHSSLYRSVVEASLIGAKFELRTVIAWVKANHTVGRGHYNWQHEPCLYMVRKGKTGHWQGSAKQSTVWNITTDSALTKHSTQKPLDCMARPIKNNSAQGEAVYDPFGGSGTTLVAAETTGRRALVMEISPEYVDLAVRRIRNYSGADAINLETGEVFPPEQEYVAATV